MGLEVQQLKGPESQKNRALKFELAGYKVVLFLANDDTDAQLFVGFRGKSISAEKANEWNRDHRSTAPTATRMVMRSSSPISTSPGCDRSQHQGVGQDLPGSDGPVRQVRKPEQLVRLLLRPAALPLPRACLSDTFRPARSTGKNP